MKEGRLLGPLVTVSRDPEHQSTSLTIELPDAEFEKDRERFRQEMRAAMDSLYRKFIGIWQDIHGA